MGQGHLEQSTARKPGDLEAPPSVTHKKKENKVDHTASAFSTYPCCLCGTDTEGLCGCTGTLGTHYLCGECETGYLLAELSPGGAFDKVQFMRGDKETGVCSKVSQVPCVRLLVGECNCVELPITCANQIVTDAYACSKQRAVDRRKKIENVKERKIWRKPKTLDDLHADVMHALIEGSFMKCPMCNHPGLKDGSCMQISCPTADCGVEWCYCCGGRGNVCRCDSEHSTLQGCFGWRSFALNGESSGIGAVNEFHRQRVRYYLQRIKHSTNPDLWQVYRQSHPAILNEIPTRGRCITWEEVDAVLDPPLFGGSTEADLLWKWPLHSPSKLALWRQWWLRKGWRWLRDGLCSFCKRCSTMLVVWVVPILAFLGCLVAGPVLIYLGALQHNQNLLIGGTVLCLGFVFQLFCWPTLIRILKEDHLDEYDFEDWCHSCAFLFTGCLVLSVWAGCLTGGVLLIYRGNSEDDLHLLLWGTVLCGGFVIQPCCWLCLWRFRDTFRH